MTLKYLFIASEENDYEPWIMKPTALAVIIIIIWVLRIFGPTAITFAQSSIDANDLMNRINQERVQRFLPALITDARLTRAAVIKSNDMINRSFFAHVNPDGNYIWPTIEAQGYTPYLTLGENLAMDFSTASAVVQAWMSSATHRANIVNTKFEDQGMGSVFGSFTPGHKSILITNAFGTLLNSSPQPAVEPAATSEPPPQPPYQTPAQATQATTSEAVPKVNQSPTPLTRIPLAQDDGVGPRSATIPVSEQAQFLPFYRNLIMTLTMFYLLILAIDSLIIYGAHIRRTNRSSSPHTLIFALIVIVNLFITLF
jgi:hypothetical protein